MSSGVGLNKNFYNGPKTIGNHGNMPPFYIHTREEVPK